MDKYTAQVNEGFSTEVKSSPKKCSYAEGNHFFFVQMGVVLEFLVCIYHPYSKRVVALKDGIMVCIHAWSAL